MRTNIKPNRPALDLQAVDESGALIKGGVHQSLIQVNEEGFLELVLVVEPLKHN